MQQQISNSQVPIDGSSVLFFTHIEIKVLSVNFFQVASKTLVQVILLEASFFKCYFFSVSNSSMRSILHSIIKHKEVINTKKMMLPQNL